jgi:hypothetical protein
MFVRLLNQLNVFEQSIQKPAFPSQQRGALWCPKHWLQPENLAQVPLIVLPQTSTAQSAAQALCAGSQHSRSYLDTSRMRIRKTLVGVLSGQYEGTT